MENSGTIKTDNNAKPANRANFEESLNHGNESTRSRYWQDSHHLLSLFPPEVWFHICSFLDHKDFLNLINSSLYFRELFLQKRVEYLGKPVLEVLLANLGEDLNMILNLVENLDTFPVQKCVENYAEVRQILLECRTVCKSWKSMIDQNASCALETDVPQNRNLVRYVLSEKFTFKESVEIDQFLHHFNATHSPNVNPFPGKYIDLHIHQMEEDFPQLCNRISVLLRKYGQNIVTIKITIMYSFENLPEFHQNFIEWLNFMPNLQILSIFGYLPMQPDNTEDEPQPELELPRFNSLKKLDLETFCAPVEEDLVPDWSWMELYKLRHLVDLHQNLESLKMTMFNKKDVEILQKVVSPLKTLKVQYHCKEDEVKLSEVHTSTSPPNAKCISRQDFQGAS